MGWADSVDQGITSLFLQGFALHGADGQPKGGVLADQGAIGLLAHGEQRFSHGSNIWALLARAMACCILTATARVTV
jgi:hypothetical protein